MIVDCWNTIGVRGDRSCAELTQHAHCRNCPVYAAAATELLRTAPLGGSLDDRTSHLAQPKTLDEGDVASVVIFRLADEWLALPTAAVAEVVNQKPIHTLPHRTGGLVLGITNVRGELLISISLGTLLGLQRLIDPRAGEQRTRFGRLVVLRRDALRVVCPVDEVHGVHRFRPATLKDVPATLARAATRYSTKLLPWNGRSVGLLDDQLLFYSMKRSIG